MKIIRETSENGKDLRALTLVGPPRDNPEQDPLAVLYHDNQLYMLRIKFRDSEGVL